MERRALRNRFHAEDNFLHLADAYFVSAQIANPPPKVKEPVPKNAVYLDTLNHTRNTFELSKVAGAPNRKDNYGNRYEKGIFLFVPNKQPFNGTSYVTHGDPLSQSIAGVYNRASDFIKSFTGGLLNFGRASSGGGAGGSQPVLEDTATITYERLSGWYSRLKGTLAIMEESRTSVTQMTVTISGTRGSREIFKETYELRYGKLPIDLDLDMTDVGTLTISVTAKRKSDNKKNSDFTILLGDVYLIPVR
jgi:hypothetical protein